MFWQSQRSASAEPKKRDNSKPTVSEMAEPIESFKLAFFQSLRVRVPI